MGDPTGIGPEVILKALSDPLPGARPLIFGQRRIFEALGLPLPSDVEWVETGGDDPGRRQVEALERGLEAVLAGRADALCTAPINKASAMAAGLPYPGHTELLARRTGAPRHAMMLAGPQLRVVPLTGHLPLRLVPDQLTVEVVADGLVLTAEALARDFALDRPRVALAALNPHAGEAGLLGEEEQRVLTPGLTRARAELDRLGVPAELSGPLPSDTLFVPPIPHDAVVCCYHDQALIPVKMLHRDRAVNLTLGLPIVRTSPAHGTAADIAGQNRADPGSMRAALELAAELVRRRRG